MTNFIIKALPDSEFTSLFGMEDSELSKLGAVRMTVDEKPGYPCRVSLEDAEVGEEVILLPYKHHKTNSPYQSAGPIFVRKGVKTASPQINEIPVMLLHRLLSLRGYDKNGMMISASVVEGKTLKDQLHKTLENNDVAYIHIHNAKPGCYNCVAERI